jgi:hypothetical protein
MEDHRWFLQQAFTAFRHLRHAALRYNGSADYRLAVVRALQQQKEEEEMFSTYLCDVPSARAGSPASPVSVPDVS